MINPSTFLCNKKCAECCIKYTVKLSKKDISKIKKLGYDEDFFVEIDRFLPEPTKFALKKKENQWCVFLKRNKKGIYSCKIYEARPTVCRRYPFLKKKVESCKPVSLFRNAQ